MDTREGCQSPLQELAVLLTSLGVETWEGEQHCRVKFMAKETCEGPIERS